MDDNNIKNNNMKKFSIALAMLAILALPSCKNRNNQNNETETEEVQVSVNAEYIYAGIPQNIRLVKLNEAAIRQTQSLTNSASPLLLETTTGKSTVKRE